MICRKCGKKLPKSEMPYMDYKDRHLCSECAVVDNNSDVCANCGKVFPPHMMFGAFCKDCAQERDME